MFSNFQSRIDSVNEVAWNKSSANVSHPSTGWPPDSGTFGSLGWFGTGRRGGFLGNWQQRTPQQRMKLDAKICWRRLTPTRTTNDTITNNNPSEISGLKMGFLSRAMRHAIYRKSREKTTEEEEEEGRRGILLTRRGKHSNVNQFQLSTSCEGSTNHFQWFQPRPFWLLSAAIFFIFPLMGFDLLPSFMSGKPAREEST